ncbi:MAG: hypothetical protein KC910_17695 [Candidatus Eremiobacteraeota bacterium]|nr:hypothetical protein [Candidatus Eremiobacteraeota bacterium]
MRWLPSLSLLWLALLTALAGAQELPNLTVQALAFSDHPEKVHQAGQLYSGGLSPLKPLRFQYYHLSQMQGSARLSLRIYNPGPGKASLAVIAGAGGPSDDYFLAGHRNNVRFLTNLVAGYGRPHQIEPGTWLELADHPFPYDGVVSGTAQMLQLDGPPLSFGLFALAQPGDPVGLTLQSEATDVHARGIYPVADQRIERGYRVGDPALNLAFGAVRQTNLWEKTELRGDYGVLYRIRLHLTNPASQPARLRIQVNPRGGEATATFHDGLRLLEVPNTLAHQLALLGEWLVPPGESTLELLTLPEGASSYPVRLVVTTVSEAATQHFSLGYATRKGSADEPGNSTREPDLRSVTW